MLATSARLLKLLSLLQARRFWSGGDLADRLAVTERTVRRDVDRLRALGYPVHATSGVAGGYALGAGASLPPLLLDDDEALAVAVGLRTAAVGSVSGMEEAAVRALSKLEPVLPARVRRRVKAFQSVVPLPRGGPSVDPERLAVIAGACRDRERLRFRYTDRHGRPSERLVEPQGLVHTGARWYLVVWDLGREDFRTLRVDRIRAPVSRDRRFAPRAVPGGDLGAYVARSIAADMYAHRARVVIHAPLAEVAERASPFAARLEPLDERRCVMLTGAHALETLAFGIALLGFEFEVLEPPELIAHLRALGERLQRAVSAAVPRL